MRQINSLLGDSAFIDRSVPDNNFTNSIPEPAKVIDWAHDAIKVDRLTTKAWEACEQKRWTDALSLLNEAYDHFDQVRMIVMGNIIREK